MRKIIFLLLAVFCLEPLMAQSDRFEINFDITGILSSQVSVSVFGDKDKITVDTDKNNTLPVEGWKIKLSGTAKSPGIVRFYFDSRNDARLFKIMPGGGYAPVKSCNLWVAVYPGARLNVTGNITGKDHIDVFATEGTGTGENDMLAKLNTRMIPLINESGNLAVLLAYKEKELSAAEKTAIETRMEEIEKELAQVRENFVNEYPSSVAALWLMEDMLIRSQIEPEQLEAPMAKVDKKYRDNYFYKTVKGRIEGARSAVVGAKCPEIKGTDQFGKAFSLKDVKGKYIIIDFWGTWCSACLAGTPHMKAFRDKHADKLQIVGVANDKNVEAWKACIERNGMNWPNVMQGKGDQDYVAKFNVQGFPTKILVSPKGIILHRESGESDDFYKKVEELIK